jgi:hypothetical protein
MYESANETIPKDAIKQKNAAVMKTEQQYHIHLHFGYLPDNIIKKDYNKRVMLYMLTWNHHDQGLLAPNRQP